MAALPQTFVAAPAPAPVAPQGAPATVADLLARLDRVRPYGNAWRARCPACDSSRVDSLSVTVRNDGAPLLHCFAHGCGYADILAAVDMRAADFYPPPDRSSPDRSSPEDRRRRREAATINSWRAALELLDLETAVVAVAAEAIFRDEPLSADDLCRLSEAHDRINRAREKLCNGR
jgi:hypothetical protein